MGYRVNRYGYILGGETIVVAYTLGGATEQGAQWAQAIPETGPYVASLVSSSHTAEWNRANLRFTYYFWVRNERGSSYWWHLSGGGVQ
jgi:hypothetical protein